MRFIELKNKLKGLTIFSIRDIEKIDKSIHPPRLVEWQAKGYIKKIIRGYYILSELDINEFVLFTIANKIYKPSYVSFEMALSYYKLIPESIYGITSASTRHTYKFNTEFGSFMYRKIKPKLMFGYKLVEYNNQTYKIAEIEKALIDLFYVKPHLNNDEDFEELRIDKQSFLEQINIEKLNNYLQVINSAVLSRRVKKFVRFIKNA